MSEQPSRLTVKVRLEPKPLHELPETTTAAPAPFSLWRLAGAAILLFALAAAISWAWWQYRPDPQLDAATRVLSQAETENVSPATHPSSSALAVLPEPVAEASSMLSSADPAPVSPTAPVSTDATATAATDVAASDVSAHAPVKAADKPTQQHTAPHSPAKRAVAPYPAGFSRIVLTAHMRNLEPGRTVGELVPYPAVKRLYLFTELNGYAGQVIQHRWYYQNELKTTATLTIEDSPWRTYSENWLLDDQQGDWRVEIVDQRQQVLYQYSFSYR